MNRMHDAGEARRERDRVVSHAATDGSAQAGRALRHGQLRQHFRIRTERSSDPLPPHTTDRPTHHGARDVPARLWRKLPVSMKIFDQKAS